MAFEWNFKDMERLEHIHSHEIRLRPYVCRDDQVPHVASSECKNGRWRDSSLRWMRVYFHDYFLLLETMQNLKIVSYSVWLRFKMLQWHMGGLKTMHGISYDVWWSYTTPSCSRVTGRWWDDACRDPSVTFRQESFREYVGWVLCDCDVTDLDVFVLHVMVQVMFPNVDVQSPPCFRRVFCHFKGALVVQENCGWLMCLGYLQV